MQPEEFQNQFALALLGHAAQRDITPARLCESAGIPASWLLQVSRPALTDQQFNNLWRNAAQFSNDPLFGLHMGEAMQLAALGIIGQIIQASNTVGEAITHACASVHLINNMFHMRMDRHKNIFRLVIDVNKEKARQFPFTFRQMADYLLMFAVHEMNGLVLQKIRPSAVRLTWPADHLSEYEKAFQGRVFFNADELSVEFAASHLDQPILSGNYELQNILLKKANGLLSQQANDSSLKTRIFNYLLTNSYLQMPSLDTVAANFNISVRSLQRKLKEEAASFATITESVRKSIAVHYLVNGAHSIKDIAHILGYNDESAFVRAFKRWTNRTPMEYRRDPDLLHPSTRQ